MDRQDQQMPMSNTQPQHQVGPDLQSFGPKRKAPSGTELRGGEEDKRLIAWFLKVIFGKILDGL